ncbi:VolA/Pla-1 family phospholipase [Thalassomonas actiniarum]|uniref:Lipase n=1 Tax=Thalassomonas actiniarum TaxID=485447 RepID=A0AAE9YWM4_9GAMM|nr:VolA/Pla-1 family phospholipase [Thalassomonas actiniarum]WDE00917.1 lipase [Thalassomonas actiniarum]
MKKLVLSLAICSALGLSGCGSESNSDVIQETAENNTVAPANSRISFNPTAGVVSVPNDLLFSGTTDGTLNLPVEDASDGSDPFVAMSALDGWSTINPFTIAIDFPEGRGLDGDSVFSPDSVKVYEMVMGGDASDADCTSLSLGLACKVVNELTFGTDFIAQASGNSIAIVPVNPLKGKTTYVVALTKNIQDDSGKSVLGSSSYELVQQDLATQPLATDAQKSLQAAVNSYENAIVAAGADRDSLIYTMAMTTQSTTDVLFTAKQLLAANVGQGVLPGIAVTDLGISVGDLLSDAGIIGATQKPLFDTANLYSGSISLPYYSGVPSADNPMAPVNEWWTSLCDSGVMLAGLAAANPDAIPEGALDANDAACMAVSDAAGLAAPGLRDLSSIMDLDTERNLTKYSPVPAPKATMALDVQLTTPDVDKINELRALQGLSTDYVMPDGGWPIVILQHGITSKKEDMLLITGALSSNGFATVAIDHPLHGSRGFDLDGDGSDEINATDGMGGSATHYMNLGSLLTTRDNLRQSSIDMLGLRLGLNTLALSPELSINSNEVHFLGHSLGAITGINFVALANAPLNEAIDPMFAINSNSLAMPGVGVANFLLESGSFKDTIKSGLTYASSTDFQGYVAAVNANGYTSTSPEWEDFLIESYLAFYNNVLNDTQRAELDAGFASFAFAAQTVTDSGDPVNYAATMKATATPTHVIEVVGDGADNLSDQVIPNTVSSSPLAGTEAGIRLLELPAVSETTAGSGAVRFLNGHHGSILNPSADATASPSVELSARATTEMQTQVVSFFAAKGQAVSINDAGVIKQ